MTYTSAFVILNKIEEVNQFFARVLESEKIPTDTEISYQVAQLGTIVRTKSTQQSDVKELYKNLNGLGYALNALYSEFYIPCEKKPGDDDAPTTSRLKEVRPSVKDAVPKIIRTHASFLIKDGKLIVQPTRRTEAKTITLAA